MKRALILVFALLATPVLPGVAGAHVEVEPSSVPAGKAIKLSLSIGHGCEGAATTSLVVQMPEGVGEFSAQSVPGWKASSSQGQMKWVGGPLPDEQLQEYPFTATFYGKKGTVSAFKAIQGCKGGAENAWIQPTSQGEAEPEYPAPVVTLASTAMAPVAAPEPTQATGNEASADAADQTTASNASADDGEGGGLGGILPIIGVALIAASVTAFIVIQRGKRKD